MNREIKFRAIEVSTGRWVYGHYTQGTDNHHYITQPNGSVWMVDPKTLGEFTGLTDKNGVEIYEGDVVKFTTAEQGEEDMGYERVEPVYFYCGAFQVRGRSLSEWNHENGLVAGQLKNRYYIAYGAKDMYMIDFNIEVIGNIHQNPELLTK